MYSANNVANYILCYYNRQDDWISNLKLQKILYFLQAEFLVAQDAPLFSDPIKAVDWGTMVDNVYHNYKIFGGGSIPILHEEKYPHYIDSEDKPLIDAVLDKLSDYTSTDLLNIIHNQKPWKMAYYYYDGCPISLFILKEYFKNK